MKTCPHCGKQFERRYREGIARWSSRIFCSAQCSNQSRAGQQRSTPWLKTHGNSRDPIYKVWTAMKQRCLNPNSASWKNYGRRGIAVCDRWLSFENFKADIGPRPPGGTLERSNNDGDYEPSNCYWADRIQQQNNMRSNQFLTSGGKTMSCRQWEQHLGFRRGTISSRKRLGWSDDEAIRTPARYGNRPDTRGAP